MPKPKLITSETQRLITSLAPSLIKSMAPKPTDFMRRYKNAQGRNQSASPGNSNRENYDWLEKINQSPIIR